MLLIAVALVTGFFLVSLMMYEMSRRTKAAQVRRVRPVMPIPIQEVGRATAADALYDALHSAFGAKYDVLCDVHPSELENDQIDPGLTRTGSLNRHIFALASKSTGEIRLVISLGTAKIAGRIARAAEERRALVVKLPIRERYDVQEVKREILAQVRKLKASRQASGTQAKPTKPEEPTMPREVIEVSSTPPFLN